MIKNKQKKINIIYLLPALKGASGGAKVIYNQSSILNSLKNNISSQILHLKKNKYYKLKLSLQKKFKLNVQNYAGWDGKQMIAAKNFSPSNVWTKKDVKNKNEINFDKNDDFLILPEIGTYILPLIISPSPLFSKLLGGGSSSIFFPYLKNFPACGELKK